ncbi:hypothetical protein AQS8620_01411 [Aquimixticola soesokkakensis]|uniref:Uncharacterized protein n=1 Tax=Aquimixticola soesokkakensis TaxID=1519096 RepID=A0A1Y5SCZ6_9RHOB|nr:hypothetical protein [Aquimixticola soesokkakensis]SLN37889.1 hypothetical protein AQS8620_01411 [Aquimixticola soesokkakensis]
MGIKLKSAGAVSRFNDPVAKAFPPVSSGLEYLNFFGLDAALSARNLAALRPNGALIGIPVVNSDHIVLTSQDAYIETGIAQPDSFTFISVAKPTADAINAPLIGNAGSPFVGGAGNTNGALLYFNKGTASDAMTTPSLNVTENIGGTATINSIGLASTAFTDLPACFIGTYDASTGVRALYNMTAGTSIIGTASAYASAKGSSLRIGSTYNTNYGGPVAHYAGGIYDRALTAGECQKLYQWIAGLLLAKRGITV